MNALPDADPARHPQLDWQEGGVPVSTRFDDPYFSLAGGLAETRHVFLAGNGLPARLRRGFHVADPVVMTSFEAWPMSLAQLEQAHAAFPDLAGLAAQLRAGWGNDRIRLGQVTLHLVIGDVAQTLPVWDGRADAWFLDGFSPAKNPQMWGDDIMAHVGRCTAPGGTFATYTAAGAVRRALALRSPAHSSTTR